MNFGKIGTNGKAGFASAKPVPIPPDVSTELDWDFVTSDPKRQRLDSSEMVSGDAVQPSVTLAQNSFPLSFTRPADHRPEPNVIPQPQPLYQYPLQQPLQQPSLFQDYMASQPIEPDPPQVVIAQSPPFADKRAAQPSLHPLPKRPTTIGSNGSPPAQLPFSTPPQPSPPKPSRIEVTLQQQPLTPARQTKTVLPRLLEGALSRVPAIQQLPPESPILLSKLKLAVSGAPPIQEFQSGIWVAGLRQRAIHPFGEMYLQCNIEWILGGGYERKKCLVVDPSGEMDGAIDRKTLDMYPGLAIGTLIELKNVAVYTRGLDRHILNITLNNVVSVEAGLPRQDEEPVELEDPLQSYAVLELPEEPFMPKPQTSAVGVLPKKKEAPVKTPKPNPAGRGRKQAPRPSPGPPPNTTAAPKFTPPLPAKQPPKQPPLSASTAANIDVAPKLDQQFRRAPPAPVTPVAIKSGPVVPSSASVIAAELAFLESLPDDLF